MNLLIIFPDSTYKFNYVYILCGGVVFGQIGGAFGILANTCYYSATHHCSFK
jgi:hypothetical protein